MVQFLANTVMAQLFRFNNNKIEYLLLKRSMNELVYPGQWQCITGTCESDEYSYQTIKRELLEETKLNFKRFFNLPYVANFFNPKKNSMNFAPSFAFEIDIDQNVVLSEEHSDYIWLSKEKALNLLVIPSHKESLILLDELIVNNKLFEVFELKNL